MTMKLESLANELLLDLFDYMSIGVVLRTLRCLNSRFDQLILLYLRTTNHLDLRFISLRDFNILYQTQLSQIANRIISITISNENETPSQIEYFCHDKFRFRQFINLQSLSLYHIHSEQIMEEIILECNYLRQLIHINLIDCCFSSDSMIDKIWNMPKLVHCHLSSTRIRRQYSQPTVISSSLKYVSLQTFYCGTCSLSNVFRFTPHIRYLHVYSQFVTIGNDIPLLPSLVKFELNEEHSSIPSISNGRDKLEILLQKMPNLCHLSIESLCILMDGCQWEKIITNYLPKLKMFRCKMAISFDNANEIELRVNNLLCSFQSHFWTESHQWFIRCHWHSKNKSEHYILYYTLPSTFTHSIAITDYLWSKSSNPYQTDHWPTHSVHKLFYNFPSPTKNNVLMKVPNSRQLKNTNQTTSLQQPISLCERMSQIFQFQPNKMRINPLSLIKKELIKTSFTPILSSTCLIPYFNAIRELSVHLPFHEYFWYLIPTLDQLTSLNILLSEDYAYQSHLQLLLDQAPNLYSLNIVGPKMLTPNFFLVNITNASIRRLNLLAGASRDNRLFYNIKQCDELSRSPLGKQCEILTIGVQEKLCIVYLANDMINLRSLTVQCDDTFINSLPSQKPCYDLVTWLTTFLPFARIARDVCSECTFHLWLR